MSTIEVPTQCESNDLLPTYGSEEAAGADLRAAIESPLTIAPMQRVLVPTGLRFAIPKGYEIQVRPRSGLALRSGITVLNTPGTIDSDYRGEVGVILINLSDVPFTVEPRTRIAQAILQPVNRATFVPQTEALASTERGEGGFGHTGTH